VDLFTKESFRYFTEAGKGKKGSQWQVLSIT